MQGLWSATGAHDGHQEACLTHQMRRPQKVHVTVSWLSLDREVQMRSLLRQAGKVLGTGISPYKGCQLCTQRAVMVELGEAHHSEQEMLQRTCFWTLSNASLE